MSTTLRITLDEYDAMIAVDAFAPLGQRRLELIHGEIREMNPPGPGHEDIVDLLTRWSTQPALRDRVRVRVQNSIGLEAHDSAPQPDVAWIKPQSYRNRRPTAAEVLLVIEVADSSINHDLGVKLALYAAAGIPEYWVVDARNGRIHSFQAPSGEKYSEHRTFASGEKLSPLAATDVVLAVNDLFHPGEGG